MQGKRNAAGSKAASLEPSGEVQHQAGSRAGAVEDDQRRARWGEATALKRSDLYLTARTVRVRVAYVERSTGDMLHSGPLANGPPPNRWLRQARGPASENHFRPGPSS
jgi:hypothetical protein